ncbi:MAG TPA: iron-containing redox enzyme family protein [Mycobacteriales bacterium]|nr:iron-containing redox enzyme family protein [Mycobacteriales bacterium]
MGLLECLDAALRDGEAGILVFGRRAGRLLPCSPAMRARTLVRIYALQSGDLRSEPAAALAHHPVVATLRWHLERHWLRDLAEIPVPTIAEGDAATVVDKLRRLAVRNRLPVVYGWLAEEADFEGLRRFLAADHSAYDVNDDLLAQAQVGLSASGSRDVLTRTQLEARGGGDPTRALPALHRSMAAALRLHEVDPTLGEESEEQCERDALAAFLAANHALQPELIGAVAMSELQAAPRARLVLRSLQRHHGADGGAGGALAYHEAIADSDRSRGRAWLDGLLRPLIDDDPSWAPRIVRGAVWRCETNARFATWAWSRLTRPLDEADGADAMVA